MERDLTQGSIWKNLLRFSLPYLLSCFLQTFYGLADLFITGQFNGSDAITAVSVGSQVMHMITVVVVGLAMGSTVTISRALGARKKNEIAEGIGNTILIFALFAAALTAVLLIFENGILSALSTPPEALSQARDYLTVCFIGVPFITAYNILSSIFRGLGDTKRPMIFVAIAGVLNIGLDYLFIGPLHMAAFGAALATVIAQAVSVLIALLSIRKMQFGFSFSRKNLRITKNGASSILRIGVPIALQDGFIQISFLVITVIANRRGVDTAAAVGIVEKFISFVFLVPSAMLSSVAAIASQNIGAGKTKNAERVLGCAVLICVLFGILITVICECSAEGILHLFDKQDDAVVTMGAQYLRSYITDTIFAGVHFCFSGYFTACGKSMISFFHNVCSILLVRIPGAYYASVHYPDTLFPMGLAAPLGSTLSAVICVTAFLLIRRKQARNVKAAEAAESGQPYAPGDRESGPENSV